MNDDHDPYKPIACSLHSDYELAIMHRETLRLGWLDTNGQRHITHALPLDLYTRDGAEYLAVRNIDGQQHEIRLDRIISSNVQRANAR